MKDRYIKLGEHSYKVSWFRSVTEDKAVSILVKAGRDKDQIKNAWKQANEKSVRKESKAKK